MIAGVSGSSSAHRSSASRSRKSKSCSLCTTTSAAFVSASVRSLNAAFFFFKQKTAYEIFTCLEFRRVLFRSVLAVIFGIFATYKGYRFDDAYPGYGELDRELGTRRTLYETKKAEYCRLVDQVFDRILDEQARLLADVKANIEYYQQLVGKSDDERRAFVHEAAEIQDACNILLKRYRQANARARTSPAPFYFNNSGAFDGSLVGPPESISEDEARLSRSYESAMKDFSDIARQNDATVQNLRTAEIRRREYYFSKLERDIRERLIREAWEIKS